MKTIFKNYFLVFSIILLVSCSEDEQAGFLYDGTGARIYGFQNTVQSVNYFEDLGTVTESVPVSLLGGADGTVSSEDVLITYEIDTDMTTAQEGVEFDFTDNSGTFTVAAGTEFTNFILNVNTGNFNPTAATTLVLNLLTTNSDATTVSALNKTVTISFVGCLSEIGLETYNLVSTRDDGASVNRGTVTLSDEGVNTYMTASAGIWDEATWACDEFGIVFTDICGVISLQEQGLNCYSNRVYPTEPTSVDANGNFTVTYEVQLGSGNRIYTDTYTKL
jgi:hypothetical protein